MNFENKAPDWSAEGIEPPSSLKESGFQAGYKPPAGYFNWFWNRVSACLSELQTKLSAMHRAPIPIVEATSEDGINYTATVEGVTGLYNGMLITIIPTITSASTAIKLDINGLGAKMVRLPLSFNNAAMTTPRLETYYTEGRPITLQYDANYLAGDGIWKTHGKQRASAQDLYGSVPIESGGTGADNAEEALENLGAASVVYVNEQLKTKAEKETFYATLPASGWSSASPYTQTITVNGILSTDEGGDAGANMSGVTNSDAGIALLEAFSFVGRVTASADNKITAYCYKDKPTIDIPIMLRVVR